jgi:hypothetical protein
MPHRLQRRLGARPHGRGGRENQGCQGVAGGMKDAGISSTQRLDDAAPCSVSMRRAARRCSRRSVRRTGHLGGFAVVDGDEEAAQRGQARSRSLGWPQEVRRFDPCNVRAVTRSAGVPAAGSLRVRRYHQVFSGLKWPTAPSKSSRGHGAVAPIPGSADHVRSRTESRLGRSA